MYFSVELYFFSVELCVTFYYTEFHREDTEIHRGNFHEYCNLPV